MKNIGLSFLIKSTGFMLVAFAMVLFSCNGDSNGATVSSSSNGTIVEGTIKGTQGMQAFLDEVSLNNSTEVIAKGDVDAKDHFVIDVKNGTKNGIYRLRMGAKRVLFPLNKGDKSIQINGDIGTISKYEFTISGSKDAQQFVDLMKNYYSRSINKDDVKAYIEQTPNPLAAALAAKRILSGDEKYMDVHKMVARNLQENAGDTPYAAEYTAFVGALERQIAARRASELVAVGQPAPEINLSSPTGKSYKLSDLKGQVVLLDFWASWCGPCRRANPHVVQTYDKYKDKGFTVYSVSLDGLDSRKRARFASNPNQLDQQLENSKKRWVQAIEKDQLKWKYHVSDLKKWESSPASLYGVRSIPRTFLIDRDGKIAVINPRNLEAELQKLL
ncbi:MAG: TlpA disulfide reductase family protein [Bacteroidota bacterium]